jgi:DNA-binding NarL/FixJ family response regulator
VTVYVVHLRSHNCYFARISAKAKVTNDPAKVTCGHCKSSLLEISERQLDVLRLMCQGLSNKMIGRSLGIDERTVKAHRSNLYSVTGCKSACQLGVWAVEHGYFSSRPAPGPNRASDPVAVEAGEGAGL